MITNRPYKLGKRPARPRANALHLSDYLDLSKLPTPPASFGHQGGVTDWGMLLNDQLGDCVCAGGIHETMLWNAEAGQKPVFTNAQALAMYEAVGAYSPDDPDSDQGCDMIAAAKYRQKTGIVDASGKKHEIAAYLSIRPGNINLLAVACYLFGAVGVGLELPDSAMDQTDAGQPWSIVSGATIEGGHYVPLVGRLPNGNYLVVTWGQLQEVSPRFLTRYCDEAVAYISCEMLNGGKTPEGFDLAQLQSDLKAMK